MSNMTVEEFMKQQDELSKALQEQLNNLRNEIWNAAIEAAATSMDSIFTEARDTDWDTGYNYCRDNFKNQIRKLKK